MRTSARHLAIVFSAIATFGLLGGCTAEIETDTEPSRDTIVPLDTTWPYDLDTVQRETVIVDRGRIDTVRIPAPARPRPDTPASKPQPTGNIRVELPRAGQTVGASFELRGEARTFENTGAYRLIDTTRRELASGYFTAVGPMGVFSRYSTIVRLKRAYRGRALLEVFENSAKDGSEINKVRILLRVEAAPVAPPPPPPPPTPSSSVQGFFPNVRQSGTDCSQVFPITRGIPPTTAVADAALRELLKGPSAADQQRGYITQIPAGVTLRSITITNGVATADFSKGLDALAGSCAVTAARAQIERTLRQFSTVRQVVITVEGRREGVLQP